jgi:hypothetical protein
MNSTKYYKGTKAQCEAYNKKVCTGEQYEGTTSRWAYTIECNGYYAILIHPGYESTMEGIDILDIKQSEE